MTKRQFRRFAKEFENGFNRNGLRRTLRHFNIP